MINVRGFSPFLSKRFPAPSYSALALIRVIWVLYLALIHLTPAELEIYLHVVSGSSYH